MNTEELRAVTARALEAALSSLDLGDAVARDLAGGRGLDCGTAILAVGKGAAQMARGALRAARGEVSGVVVVGPAGGPAFDRSDARVVFLEAPHPDPDRRSMVAARRAIDLLRRAERTLALVSGGASSLICLPQRLSLAHYVRVVRRLSLAGAPIREVNIVRRHLCAVKGGGLVRAARGPIQTLVASDVIGGALHDVGSGPTVADPTTRAEARAVLRRFGVAESSSLPFHESLKPNAPQARRASARFVARPEDLAHAVAAELRARGLRVRCLAPSLEPAGVLAREYLLRALGLRPGEALVRSAEPSLRVSAAHPGRGGRSTHLALLAGSSLPAGVVFVAGASDGVDGTSGAGGAAVDASLRERASAREISAALARFDSGRLLRRVGLALPGGWTGHNLADVHVLARG